MVKGFNRAFQGVGLWICGVIFTAVVAGFALLPRSPAAGETELLYGQGLLWKLEREGEAASYLFGTMHIADPRILDLPAPVRAAFDGSDLAVFEVIIDPQAQAEVAQRMILTNGRTLDQILSPELYQQVVETASNYSMAEALVRLLKPWALIPIFSFPPEQYARVAAGEAPLDDWLQKEANNQGIALVALETVDEQLSLFDDTPEADQVGMLEMTVKDRAKVLKQFDQLITAYLAQDTAAIYDQMTDVADDEETRLSEVFEQDFVVARNQRMAERLQGKIGGGNAFVAVGALHLPGEQGLIHLMEEAGYSVSRVY